MAGGDSAWCRRLTGLRCRMNQGGWRGDYVDGTIALLQRLKDRECGNSNRILSRLAGSVTDWQQFADNFLEAWAADLFLANGYQVVYEPCGTKGPDLSVGNYFYVEVTRKRENEEERARLETRELVDIPDLVPTMMGTFQNKLSKHQAIAGEVNLLLLRSSRGFLNYQQAKSAFQDLIREGFSTTDNLSGMIFDDGWRDAGVGPLAWSRRIHVDRNPTCRNPLPLEQLSRLRSLKPPDSDDLLQTILSPTFKFDEASMNP